MRHTPLPPPPHRGQLRRTGLVASLMSLVMVLANPVHGAATDLATAPLQTATPTAKPNLMFILDDSGSMGWDFMPDWADTNTDSLARNSGFNATYYNPAIQYEAPVRRDGSRYPTMTAATTNSWRNVPFDGFGVQTASGTGNVLFTDSNSGTTQNLVGRAYYYVFIPGEYCADPGLRTCVAGVRPTLTHPFPALLRWCSDAGLRNCRATRINSAPPGVPTYTRVRAAGVSGVPGRNMRVDIVSGNNSYAHPGIDDKAPTRGDCAGRTCTYAEEMTNFANWWAYYRTRMQMAKSAASIAFADVDEKFRIGYMSINNNTGVDFLNVRDVDSDPNGQKFQWFSKLLAAEPGSSTPLRSALSTAGRYYANKLTRVNGVNTTDPMQYACQRNFTMLSTDGYWNDRGNFTGVQDGSSIGDVDGANGVARPYYDGTRTASTLADIAQYFYATDIRTPGFGNDRGALGSDVASNNVDDKQQRMYTYTIGLGASGYMQYQQDYDTAGAGDYADVAAGVTAGSVRCGWQSTGACNWPQVVSNEQTTIDDLWHAAVNGRGRYYSAANPVDLRDGLQAFIADVAKSSATKVTAAATSTLNLTANNNLAFGTEYKSGAWYGDVYAYQLDPKTGAAMPYFLWSQSESLSSSASTKTTPVLANMPAASRRIYTAEFANTPPSPKRIGFQWAEMSNNTKRHFRTSAINKLSQFCASGSSCVLPNARVDTDTAGRATGIGGINLVNFLRGDRVNEGQDNLSYYRKREHILGDIVDAQPVYVKKPLFNYADAGYLDFKTAQADRQAMVYVGANDGMLHAFRAEDGTTDGGKAGAEAWAYIPSMLLPEMHKLADKDYANRHTYYVNATPRVGDIYYNSAWRTILVGGLGRGGRGYYALDITDAPNPPTVLWEFSNENSQGAGHSSDQDLGYTYGTPVITKLSDGTWVAIVTSGYNNVSQGSGRGIIWVLNAATGKILHKIDTQAGTATPQAGCGTAPCPAGLAHIKVFADNGDRNNLGTRVYGGDLLGNVWRIDISGLTATGGSATATKLTTLTATNGTRQPVTSAPELGKVDGIPVVFIGTGSYLGLSDLGTTGKQSIYAIKDTLGVADAQQGMLHPSPRTVTCPSTGGKDCFVRQVITEDKTKGVRNAQSTLDKGLGVDFRTMRGWYIEFPNDGERMVYEPELQRGILAFMTSIPGSAEACKLGGTSYVNYIDYATGLALPGVDNIGFPIDGGPSGGITMLGLEDGSTVILGGGGKSSEREDKKPPPKIPPKAGEGTRRISWRELVTDQ